MGALDAAIPRNVILFQATDEKTVQTGSYIVNVTAVKTMTLQIKRALTL